MSDIALKTNGRKRQATSDNFSASSSISCSENDNGNAKRARRKLGSDNPNVSRVNSLMCSAAGASAGPSEGNATSLFGSSWGEPAHFARSEFSYAAPDFEVVDNDGDFVAPYSVDDEHSESTSEEDDASNAQPNSAPTPRIVEVVSAQSDADQASSQNNKTGSILSDEVEASCSSPVKPTSTKSSEMKTVINLWKRELDNLFDVQRQMIKDQAKSVESLYSSRKLDIEALNHEKKLNLNVERLHLDRERQQMTEQMQQLAEKEEAAQRHLKKLEFETQRLERSINRACRLAMISLKKTGSVGQRLAYRMRRQSFHQMTRDRWRRKCLLAFGACLAMMVDSERKNAEKDVDFIKKLVACANPETSKEEEGEKLKENEKEEKDETIQFLRQQQSIIHRYRGLIDQMEEDIANQIDFERKSRKIVDLKAADVEAKHARECEKTLKHTFPASLRHALSNALGDNLASKMKRVELLSKHGTKKFREAFLLRSLKASHMIEGFSPALRSCVLNFVTNQQDCSSEVHFNLASINNKTQQEKIKMVYAMMSEIKQRKKEIAMSTINSKLSILSFEERKLRTRLRSLLKERRKGGSEQDEIVLSDDSDDDNEASTSQQAISQQVRKQKLTEKKSEKKKDIERREKELEKRERELEKKKRDEPLRNDAAHARIEKQPVEVRKEDRVEVRRPTNLRPIACGSRIPGQPGTIFAVPVYALGRNSEQPESAVAPQPFHYGYMVSQPSGPVILNATTTTATTTTTTTTTATTGEPALPNSGNLVIDETPNAAAVNIQNSTGDNTASKFTFVTLANSAIRCIPNPYFKDTPNPTISSITSATVNNNTDATVNNNTDATVTNVNRTARKNKNPAVRKAKKAVINVSDQVDIVVNTSKKQSTGKKQSAPGTGRGQSSRRQKVTKKSARPGAQPQAVPETVTIDSSDDEAVVIRHKKPKIKKMKNTPQLMIISDDDDEPPAPAPTPKMGKDEKPRDKILNPVDFYNSVIADSPPGSAEAASETNLQPPQETPLAPSPSVEATVAALQQAEVIEICDSEQEEEEQEQEEEEEEEASESRPFELVSSNSSSGADLRPSEQFLFDIGLALVRRQYYPTAVTDETGDPLVEESVRYLRLKQQPLPCDWCSYRAYSRHDLKLHCDSSHRAEVAPYQGPLPAVPLWPSHRMRYNVELDEWDVLHHCVWCDHFPVWRTPQNGMRSYWDFMPHVTRCKAAFSGKFCLAPYVNDATFITAQEEEKEEENGERKEKEEKQLESGEGKEATQAESKGPRVRPCRTTWSCELCSKVLPSRKLAFKHMERHDAGRNRKLTSLRRLRCRICQIVFATPEGLFNHIVPREKKTAGGDVYACSFRLRCPLCPIARSLMSLRAWPMHFLVKHADMAEKRMQNQVCPLCYPFGVVSERRQLPSDEHLSRHLVRWHGIGAARLTAKDGPVGRMFGLAAVHCSVCGVRVVLHQLLKHMQRKHIRPMRVVLTRCDDPLLEAEHVREAMPAGPAGNVDEDDLPLKVIANIEKNKDETSSDDEDVPLLYKVKSPFASAPAETALQAKVNEEDILELYKPKPVVQRRVRSLDSVYSVTSTSSSSESSTSS